MPATPNSILPVTVLKPPLCLPSGLAPTKSILVLLPLSSITLPAAVAAAAVSAGAADASAGAASVCATGSVGVAGALLAGAQPDRDNTQSINRPSKWIRISSSWLQG